MASTELAAPPLRPDTGRAGTALPADVLARPAAAGHSGGLARAWQSGW
ncbi:MAG TPA: hypothetical protein VE645_17680 [Pseudonocardiaceae bacterium]|jgi:hypothetical protein|nr:hypothetical protein [Pseudonocardiaceae bacterium]